MVMDLVQIWVVKIKWYVINVKSNVRWKYNIDCYMKIKINFIWLRNISFYTYFCEQNVNINCLN